MSEKTIDELWEMIDKMQNDLAYYKTQCENLEKAIKDYLETMGNAWWDLNHVVESK